MHGVVATLERLGTSPRTSRQLQLHHPLAAAPSKNGHRGSRRNGHVSAPRPCGKAHQPRATPGQRQGMHRPAGEEVGAEQRAGPVWMTESRETKAEQAKRRAVAPIECQSPPRHPRALRGGCRRPAQTIDARMDKLHVNIRGWTEAAVRITGKMHTGGGRIVSSQ